MPLQKGPDLGYAIVGATTPCASGWLVGSAKVHAANFALEYPRVLSRFAEALDQRPAFNTLVVNAPIGYLDDWQKGGRSCDRIARRQLGHRGSSVRSAPVRAVLNDEEPDLSHLDAVTRHLLPRYREVAAEMAPFRQRSVYEVHPELSFFQLNGDAPLRFPKRTEEGRTERLELLGRRIPGLDLLARASLEGVRPEHLLDVAAMLWTARRIFSRSASRVPDEPEWDDEGLRMELVL